MMLWLVDLTKKFMQTKALELSEADLLQRHQRILAGPTPRATEGGTTALVVVQHEGQLHAANVGDCRAILGR